MLEYFKIMEINLTKGPVTKNILLFALPLMVGNLMQQMYNIADTWVVGKYIGSNALAAVGSSYTLMTFLTSILIGLCMGASAYISMLFGKDDHKGMRQSIYMSFLFISTITILITALVYLFHSQILQLLQIPNEILAIITTYLLIIYAGIPAVFLYNYFSNLLRSIGNSLTPLIFLAISSILNVILDLFCVLVLDWGVGGTAIATIFSQYVSGIGIMLFTCFKNKQLLPQKQDRHWDKKRFSSIMNLSIMTSLQQSIMNFGILMVQGLVNSFGTNVMAAFAAAVKIDSFAYMPVQDFGNAFSTYVAQNYGAKDTKRIKQGMKSSFLVSILFSMIVSTFVFIFSKQLLEIFIDSSELEILSTGIQYLRIEGTFYFGIGILFLLYGYYRAVNVPWMSLLLTIASLGTRVLLAYILSTTSLGVVGIWMSVPIGWGLADMIGISYYFLISKKQIESIKKDC